MELEKEVRGGDTRRTVWDMVGMKDLGHQGRNVQEATQDRWQLGQGARAGDSHVMVARTQGHGEST